ncbi:hypothetical protein [Microbacterium sp. Bi121]|uniref:hypothetical protein n=1 Tax=Microbacterium sp. Bi121 TaxID=2822348 RepID=UPI001DDD561C|nr:hypothetical protein [Microbacterium sp. Bi121]CAH0148614.1 4,5-dihydroxyphthalate decarboxylase [Microbacterium sp. Bi121]
MRLSTLTRPQGANRALIDGEVAVDGASLDFADEPVLVKGFRKMVRGVEFDVAELALTTYLTAKEHGAPYTALPIFLVRDFHHGATQVLRGSRDRAIPDFAGARIGVNRGYTVTTGVWGRHALAQAGLDLDTVTWIRSGDEHVPDYQAPGNVVPAPAGATLADLLLAGELDAVVGAAIDHPEVVPLIADPDDVAAQQLQSHGVFPINHLVVVRDDLLARHPELGPALFEAFAEAKRRYVAGIAAAIPASRQDRVLTRVMKITGSDPLPYGMAENLPTLEALIETAIQQGILRCRPAWEDVFAASTMEMSG